MAQPHLSNAKAKFTKDVFASDGAVPVEYQASAWLRIDNGWDEANRRPIEMTPEQQAKVDEVARLLLASNIQLQMTVKERTGNDPQGWPVALRVNLFPNNPAPRKQESAWD